MKLLLCKQVIYGIIQVVFSLFSTWTLYFQIILLYKPYFLHKIEIQWNSCEILLNPTNVQPNKLRGLTFIFVYKSVSTNLTFVDNSKNIL